jgi:hypothetical protein
LIARKVGRYSGFWPEQPVFTAIATPPVFNVATLSVRCICGLSTTHGISWKKAWVE